MGTRVNEKASDMRAPGNDSERATLDRSVTCIEPGFVNPTRPVAVQGLDLVFGGTDEP
jgi:hypothetical protein